MYLKGKNIELRPIDKSDLAKLYIWHNDPVIKKMAMMHPFPVTMELEDDWLQNILNSKNNNNIYFSITAKNKFIGYTYLKSINYVNKTAFYAIVIGDSEQQSKGFGKEVVGLVIDYAFKNLNLNKIIVEVLSENQKSLKLFESNGFEKEGILKKQFYFDGKYYDVVLLSLFNKLLKTVSKN